MNCRKCGRELLGNASHIYNVVAERHGCCCFGCLIGVEGIDEAFRKLEKEKKEAKKMMAQMQPRR